MKIGGWNVFSPKLGFFINLKLGLGRRKIFCSCVFHVILNWFLWNSYAIIVKFLRSSKQVQILDWEGHGGMEQSSFVGLHGLTMYFILLFESRGSLIFTGDWAANTPVQWFVGQDAMIRGPRRKSTFPRFNCAACVRRTESRKRLNPTGPPLGIDQMLLKIP